MGSGRERSSEGSATSIYEYRELLKIIHSHVGSRMATVNSIDRSPAAFVLLRDAVAGVKEELEDLLRKEADPSLRTPQLNHVDRGKVVAQIETLSRVAVDLNQLYHEALVDVTPDAFQWISEDLE
jgi:hypothetical protein